MSRTNKNNNELTRNKISTFNSKLFLDMELSEENINSNSDTDYSNVSIEIPDMKLKDFLSNDLIEELKLPPYRQKTDISNNLNNNRKNLIENENYKYILKNNNFKNGCTFKLNNNVNIYNSLKYNPLLPLINKGFEFFPKSIKSNDNEKDYKINCEDNNIINYIKQNENLFKINKKNDWHCIICNNINYGFRVKCNRCGFLKDSSSDNIYKKFNEQKTNNTYQQNKNNYNIFNNSYNQK